MTFRMTFRPPQTMRDPAMRSAWSGAIERIVGEFQPALVVLFGSVFLMLQHLLGLEPDLPNGRISLRPALMLLLGELRFENMRLGDRTIDVRVWRAGDDVKCEVDGADGLEVTIAPVRVRPPTRR